MAIRGNGSTDPTIAAGEGGAETRDDKDSFDEVLRRVVRGPGAPRELAIGTLLAGRFAIERVIGIGGMGTVYAARDQSLGREVAIKVHHAPGGGVRLRREAIAMARLAHPNVVTVFEVGEVERHPFVVMEYVTGTTLREWLTASPRSVREILDALIAAGEGLAAAHDAGLVHRDIKPENVLIGSDGRARVGDFGLARELDSKEEPAPPPTAHALTSMTQTGAVLGTPAYMAPEQIEGGTVDARADQFAFCVMAWEALWKERPFGGATFEQLSAAVTRGERRAPPPLPKVSARVRAALERGLATRADERLPSIHALITELREPVRRRRRIAAALVLAGAALGVAGYFALVRAGEASCDAVADPDLPRGLPAQLRALGEGAAAERVQLVIDHLSTQYRSVKRYGCEALNVNHAWSPELAAKSDACIAVEMQVARRLLSAAPVTRASAFELVRRAGSARRLDPCIDPSYLAASAPVPSDPAQLAAFVSARAELQILFADIDHTPRAKTQALLDALARSPAHADPQIGAGIMIVRARVLAVDGKLAEANKLLADAYYAARTVDDPEDTLAALTGLISTATRVRVDHQAADQWLRTALADAERLRARSPWFAVRVDLMAARIADDEEDAARALAYVEAARVLVHDDDTDAGDLLVIKGDVLMWSGHVDEGVAAYEAAIASDTARFGPDDPSLGSSLTSYASSLLAAGRAEKALEVATRAEHLIASSADPGRDRLDGARVNLAAVLIGADRDDEALPLLRQARKDDVASFGEHNAIVANIDSNLAVIEGDRGNHAAALALQEKVLAIDEEERGPDSLDVANRLYNISLSLGKLGRFSEALARAQRAAAIAGAKSNGSPLHQHAKVLVAVQATLAGEPGVALAMTTEVITAGSTTSDATDRAMTLAWAHLERAKALIALHRGGEARRDLTEARAGYAGLNMAARVDEVETLMRTLR